MIKELKEEILLKETAIESVEFDGEWYFKVADISAYLGEDLTGVEAVVLPIRSGDAECTTVDFINAFRSKAVKTDFDKKIRQALNFNPNKKS